MIDIAVVTVTFNAEQDIEVTLKSVLEQNYKNLSYVVMDGGSSDGTISIINSYKEALLKKGIALQVISEKDNGIYNAMNNSLKYINSEYVLFLNAGDYFTDANTISAIFNDSNILEYDVIYGDYYLYYQNYRKYVESLSYIMLPNQMISTHQSFFVKTGLLQNRPYNECYKMAADYDFFLEMFLKGKSFFHVNVPVVYFKTEGISQQKALLTQQELLDIQCKYIGMSNAKKFYKMCCIPFICVKKILLNIIPKNIRYLKYKRWQNGTNKA